jgi:hypothetical protein
MERYSTDSTEDEEACGARLPLLLASNSVILIAGPTLTTLSS